MTMIHRPASGTPDDGEPQQPDPQPDPEPDPAPSYAGSYRTRQSVTTRVIVEAEFAGEDLTLGHVRDLVRNTASLPDEALVSLPEESHGGLPVCIRVDYLGRRESDQ